MSSEDVQGASRDPCGSFRLPDEARSFRERAHLTDAAVREMADHGYRAVTVTSIAERAGLPRDAFYAQFPDKDAALVHAYDVAVAFAAPRIFAAMRAAADWREAAAAALTTYLAILDCDHAWALVCLRETAEAGEQVRRAREALRAPIVDALDRLPDDPEAAPIGMGTVLSGLDAIAVDALLHRPDQPLTSRRRELTRFVLAPFSGATPPDEIDPPPFPALCASDRVEALVGQGRDGDLALELLVRAAVSRRDGPTLWRVIVGLQRRRAAGHAVPERVVATALEGMSDAWFFGLVAHEGSGCDG